MVHTIYISSKFYNKLSNLNKKNLFFKISTDEVYGNKKNDKKFSEEHQINPRSPYSATKAGSDHLVSWFHTYNFLFLLPIAPIILDHFNIKKN